ncbi:FAD-dependent oxidoreductase [Lentisalinibacter sediminis]|uniref:FAD-dependent oxidoreductase n=1 Tax=Lentisalinibacter sediminis TaxID=2992237 RepID=UPI00386B7BE6
MSDPTLHGAGDTGENPVAILGAGLTGSLLAILLARRGHAVDLYERQPDLRTHRAQGGRSINLALAARGLRGLALASLTEAVEPLLMPMSGRLLHQEDGGLDFQPYGQHEGEENYSVSRADLNRVLLDAAEAAGARLHFSEACSSIDLEARRATLRHEETGAERQIFMAPLIAADGAGSVVRRALADAGHIGASESLLAHGYKELTIPPGDDGGFRIDPGALHIWPRGGFMLIALPNPGGDFTVTLFLPNEGPESFASLDDEASVQAFFERHFPDTPALIPDLAEQFAANPVGILGTVRCEPWNLGGDVLLVGDAAHAIVPFHGQGMNAGFEDCAEFCRLLDGGCEDRERLFGEFSRLRRPNAEAIADMALENYVEMRDTVRDPSFHLKKALAFELERRCPDRFVPRYSMVMFHAEIPYAEALARGEVQARLLDELTADADSLADVDLALAERLVSERLAALPCAPA